MPTSARAATAATTGVPPVTLLYLIKQVELAVRSRFDDVTAEFGVTTVQYTALTVLERHPGLIAAQLARMSFVRAQSMTQLLDVLESRGLVERMRDPASRRQLRIYLTADGQDLLDSMREPAAEIEAEMTAALSADNVAALSEMLLSCRAALAG